jgi:hypothetical protein
VERGFLHRGHGEHRGSREEEAEKRKQRRGSREEEAEKRKQRRGSRFLVWFGMAVF